MEDHPGILDLVPLLRDDETACCVTVLSTEAFHLGEIHVAEGLDRGCVVGNAQAGVND